MFGWTLKPFLLILSNKAFLRISTLFLVTMRDYVTILMPQSSIFSQISLNLLESFEDLEAVSRGWSILLRPAASDLRVDLWMGIR